ncbi:hypothetical protein ACFODL_02635 [Phenylobacterium terrae]|uniref:Glycerophosphoryl diester phosphodiesterase membrane domain-containing protein n=2 Tax=Phenylobacterium terrae TaxID=2665495 RepID=A0ABW4N3X5_9CAUL
MRDFSIGEAGLVGFRLTRERPRAIAVWCGLNLVFSFVSLLVLVGIGGPALNTLQATTESTAAQDPAATMALFNQLLPAYGLFVLIWLAFSAVMAAAASRAVLHPQDETLGYVRFGADELRVLAVLVVVGVILFFAYMGASVASGLVLAIVMGVTGGAGGAAGATGLMLVMIPLVMLGILWLWTRFSLAVPMTLARGRVDVFGSWALTKGRSGKVFLTYLAAFALYLLVAMLGLAISLGVGAAISGGDGPLEAMMRPDMSSIGAYFTPAMIANTIVMAVIGGLGSAIVLCPPAVIYAALAGEQLHEVF